MFKWGEDGTLQFEQTSRSEQQKEKDRKEGRHSRKGQRRLMAKALQHLREQA